MIKHGVWLHGVQKLSVVSDVQTCQKLQADEGLATSESRFNFQLLFFIAGRVWTILAVIVLSFLWRGSEVSTCHKSGTVRASDLASFQKIQSRMETPCAVTATGHTRQQQPTCASRNPRRHQLCCSLPLHDSWQTSKCLGSKVGMHHFWWRSPADRRSGPHGQMSFPETGCSPWCNRCWQIPVVILDAKALQLERLSRWCRSKLLWRRGGMVKFCSSRKQNGIATIILQNNLGPESIPS